MGLIKRGALFRTNDLFRPFQTIKWQIKQNKQVEVFLMFVRLTYADGLEMRARRKSSTISRHFFATVCSGKGAGVEDV